MKSFLLKTGFITTLMFSLFNGKTFAETTTSTPTDWSNKCTTFGDIKPNENPSFQQINCLLTNAAIDANIPPEVVKAVASQESGWRQFNSDGTPFVSDDKGIGIMQITNHPEYNQDQLTNDIVYNIQAGVDILSKNYDLNLPKIKNAGRDQIENWYFPVMAYNGIKPVNSPLFKDTGKPNSNAYQEKVFRKIEADSFLSSTKMLAQFPFSVTDFDYDTTSDANIKFLKMEYTLTDKLHDSFSTLKTGDTVLVTKDNVYVRPQPSTTGGSQVPHNTQLIITGNFTYDTTSNSNVFVWFPVKTVDGKLVGYITSAYITKKTDFTAPVVSGVENNHFYNKDVKVSFNEGNATLNGASIPSGKTVSNEGTYTLVVKDDSGNLTRLVFTIDKTKPTVPVLNTISDQMTKITGKTSPYTTVKLYVNYKYQKTVTSTSNGSFQFTVSKQRSGSKVNVIATDKAGNISSSKTLTVLDKTGPLAPFVNPVTTKSVYVSGSAEKGTTVYIYRGNTKLQLGKVNSAGKFSLKIGPQKRNVVLSVYAVDQANNKGSVQLVTVK